MSSADFFSRKATAGLGVKEFDSLKPYTSFHVVQCPLGELDGLVEGILDSLPSLLDEILVDRLVADIDEILAARSGRPRWFSSVTKLLEFEGDSARKKAPFLRALESRLRHSRGQPPMHYADGEAAKREPDLATRVCDLVGLDMPTYRRRSLMTARRPNSDGALEIGAFSYLEQRLSGWRIPDWRGPADLLHQLVLVCRLRAGPARRHLAFYSSEPTAKRMIARSIGATDAPRPFDALAKIDRRVLDGAFVQRDRPAKDVDSQRRIRALWLAGIHRSAAWKADGKLLIGPDLENALEPLADQSYYFTAARCLVPVTPQGESLTVGVSPQRSSVWAGPVPSWGAFRQRVAQLLRHIAGSPAAERPPLAVLAAQVQVNDPAEVAGASVTFLLGPEKLANTDAGGRYGLARLRRRGR